MACQKDVCGSFVNSNMTSSLATVTTDNSFFIRDWVLSKPSSSATPNDNRKLIGAYFGAYRHERRVDQWYYVWQR